MSTRLCNAYLEMQVFAHIRLTILSGPLMPCLGAICMFLINDVHHLIFSDDFKGLTLFTNLHFHPLI